MPAYVIVEIEIVDPTGYEEYKKLASATVEKYGGKYIVRGGAAETLEGDWKPKRIVVLQFESTQRAKDWPIIQLLVAIHYRENGASPRPDWIKFWLSEARTPELLIELVATRRLPARLTRLCTRNPGRS